MLSMSSDSKLLNLNKFHCSDLSFVFECFNYCANNLTTSLSYVKQSCLNFTQKSAQATKIFFQESVKLTTNGKSFN